jgi:MFS family permease
MRNLIKRLGEQLALKENIRILAMMAVLGGAQFSMIVAVWQPFVISLGASVTFLGLLQSLGGFYGIVPAIFGPIGGWASDRVGRKLLILLGMGLRMAALFIYILALVINNWLLLVPGVLFTAISMLSVPAWDSMVAESIERGKRGMAFAVMGFFTHVPTIFLPVIAGFIAGRLGFLVVFLILVTLRGISIALASIPLKETLRESVEKITSFWGALRKSLGRIFTPPTRLRPFYIIIAVDAIAWGLGASILYGMLVKSYNFTTLQIGALVSISNIAKVLCQLPAGRLIDKYGSKALLLTSQAVGVCLVVGWLLSTRFEAFAALSILYGISATAWFPARKVFLAGSVTPAERGEAMGRILTFQGMAGFPAPFIGGLLYDHFGFWAPISGNLIGVFATLMLIAFTIREPQRPFA